MYRRYLILLPLLVIALFPVPSWSIPFSNLVVFGDSLSDSGNVAVATTQRSTPPFGDLVPAASYASGRFSNGPVWAEQLAAELGLSAAPSLLGGTDFAFGGARTGLLPGVPATASPTLLDQLGMFLATPDARKTSFLTGSLFVLWGGADDIRDAAALTASGADATTVSQRVNAVLQAAVGNLADLITGLATAGAINLLVLNAPDIGLTPEARSAGLAAQATSISAAFNGLLATKLTSLSATLPVDLHSFDVFQLLHEVVAQPAQFGLSNVTDPCIHLNTTVAPSCAQPDSYLFWDGIHPTTAGHAVLARAVRRALIPVPDMLALFGIGLVMLGLGRKGDMVRPSSTS